MGKKRRKSTSCFNCATPLVNGENYCPNCGQENHNKQASIGILVNDFLGDFLSFDSKLFRSLKPLLFQPGTMTRDYLDGKRQKFIPPIRLFLFLSFIYFGLSLLLFDEAAARVTIDGESINNAAVDNFSEAMRRNMNILFFFFTPIQALIILIFFRSKERKFYVNFFVFTLHTFSLLLILGILIDLLNWALTSSGDTLTTLDYIILSIDLALILYFLAYSVLALKRVFQKKYNLLLFIAALLFSIIAFLLLSIGFVLFFGWSYNIFS